MAAAEIQVVNPANLLKIESFLNDSAYKEVIESSSSFNSRLCADRRMRMPFLDPQTGVAQNHCNLFMSKRQRMPGAREGQVYTYPSQRWRKARRQYLAPHSSRWGWSRGAEPPVVEGTNEDSTGLPGDAGGEDSRDGSQTQQIKEDSKQDWFYDELAMDEIAELEEPEPESDEDYYDDTYANRRKRRGGVSAGAAIGASGRGVGRRSKVAVAEDTPAKRGRAGRGRRRGAQGILPYEVPGDADKPYGCEQCGARYKTRPGLTYHFTHTHKEPKEGVSDGDSRDSARGGESSGAAAASTSASAASAASAAANAASEYQDSYVTFLNNPATAAVAASASVRRPTPPPRPASADTSSSDSTPAPAAAAVSAAPAAPPDAPAPASSAHAAPAPPAAPAAIAPTTTSPSAPPATLATRESKQEGDVIKASPSPYCDFCLGDDRENKKTGTPEQLVSCSDCGRSGKPPRNGYARNGRLRNGHNRHDDPPYTHSNSYSAEDFDSFVLKVLESDPKGMEREDSSPSPPMLKPTRNKLPQVTAPQEKRSPGRPRKNQTARGGHSKH